MQHAARLSLLLAVSVASLLLVTYNLVQYRGTNNHNSIREDELWDSLQRDRVQRMKDTCLGFVEPDMISILEDKNFLIRLLYNDKHKIIYCPIPKIASTNWKRIFTVLNGRVNTTVPLDVPSEFVHRRDVTLPMSLWSLSYSERLRRLNTYKKFVFVRHPFERLLSAYNNKLRGNSTSSIQHFQKVYGTRILRLYRPGASKQVIARGGDVTFPEFVRYLTDTRLKYRLANYHWAPMSQICKPCQVNYDYIGKYDTFLHDVGMVLNKSNITLPYSFPPKYSVSSNTRDQLYWHMKQLTENQVHELYKIYKNDFELFGYDYMDWGPQP